MIATGLIRVPVSIRAWMQEEESRKWRPLPDSNRNRRFRTPELYPVELRGLVAVYQEYKGELHIGRSHHRVI
jgi:hypothetical protein